MPRTFRVTCARTTYFDIDVAAESSAEVERVLERTIKDHPELCQRLSPPTHRIVEVAASDEADAGSAPEVAA